MVKVHYHSQEQSEKSLHYLQFSAVWSGSTLFAILCSLISLHYLPFSATDHVILFFLCFLSSIITIYTVCHSFLAVLSRSTLFSIFSCLISVYTISHSQQCDHGLHFFPFSAVWSRSTLFAIQSYQGLHDLPFSAVWSVSTLFAILRLIRVYIIYHCEQSVQGLLYLPFSAVWSRSALFAILNRLIRVYTICFFFLASIIMVCTVCRSQQSDKGPHFLPFSAVWSGSTLIAIFSSLIRVYASCRSQFDQGLHYLPFFLRSIIKVYRGARWLSGRVSDSGARGPGFETYRRRVVSLSKTLYSPKVLVNYPGSDGSVPIWLKNCWLGR